MEILLAPFANIMGGCDETEVLPNVGSYHYGSAWRKGDGLVSQISSTHPFLGYSNPAPAVTYNHDQGKSCSNWHWFWGCVGTWNYDNIMDRPSGVWNKWLVGRDHLQVTGLRINILEGSADEIWEKISRLYTGL
jgi:hypothetical protein